MGQVRADSDVSDGCSGLKLFGTIGAPAPQESEPCRLGPAAAAGTGPPGRRGPALRPSLEVIKLLIAKIVLGPP